MGLLERFLCPSPFLGFKNESVIIINWSSILLYSLWVALPHYVDQHQSALQDPVHLVHSQHIRYKSFKELCEDLCVFIKNIYNYDIKANLNIKMVSYV